MSVVGAKFGGQVSPAAMLADALSKSADYERAILVVKVKDTNEVIPGYTSGSVLEAIGMLEAAKDQLLQLLHPE